MFKTYFVILFTIYFTKGYSQASLTIFNQSSTSIDSIVIKGTKSFNIGSINKSEKSTFFIGVDQANFHSFAPFYLWIYSEVLTTKFQWQRTGFNDSIYFFDHGISKANVEPERPEIFYLDINNTTSEKVDTIFTGNGAIIQIMEYSPRRIIVHLNHKELKPEQFISVRLGHKVISTNLENLNINDWNVMNGSFYLGKDSIFNGNIDRNFAPFEFVIDFKLYEGVSFNDIKIDAKHLLKTYNNIEENRLRAVFDYSSFISDPRFKIKINRKSHSIMLKHKDLDGSEYKEISITKKKIYL